MLQHIVTNDQLNQIYLMNIKPLKPSKCPEKIENIYPQPIIGNMDDYVIKEINETIMCFRLGLWTATSLMSFRLIEGELKIHIEDNLGIKKQISTLGECIDQLRTQGVNTEFLNSLDAVRQDRNDAMHANLRFSSEKAIQLFHLALWIVLWIYNINNNEIGS